MINKNMLHDWEIPQITSRNRLTAHTPLSSWRSESEALSDFISDSLLSLDGYWAFAFVTVQHPHIILAFSHFSTILLWGFLRLADEK